MSKELEALDELHCVAYGMKKYDENTIKAEKIIETALKALEVFKNHFGIEDYTHVIYAKELQCTKQEYELLKEELN